MWVMIFGLVDLILFFGAFLQSGVPHYDVHYPIVDAVIMVSILVRRAYSARLV